MKCKFCETELDFLDAFSLEENRQTVSLNGDSLEWRNLEVIEGSCQKISLECPYCGKTLYENEGDSLDPEIVKLLEP